MKRVSEEGEAFLKVATAAPDYESLDFQGIPDSHSGPTVCMRQYVTTTVTALAGKATYFLGTPTAASAYFSTSVPTGTDWINGQDLESVVFPKAGQIFSNSINPNTGSSSSFGGSNTTQVSSGRLVSSAMELNCLNNAFNQYGSITAWKVPLNSVVENKSSVASTVVARMINGIAGCTSQVVGSQAYTAPVRDGVYAVAMNRESEFNYFPIRDTESKNSSTDAPFGAQGASPGTRAKFNGPIVLWDNNFDTIVFRIDVPPGVADQSFLLKRWVNFEAEPVFNSLLYDVAHLSPRADPAAIFLYNEICRGLPTAVRAKDNPDFWSRVLEIVSEASNVLSYVPGPIGGVAKGVHAVARALAPSPKKTKTNGKVGKKGNNKKK
jgi:hypothetical protein